MIRTRFVHDIYGEQVKVIATAKDVDAYGAIGLKLRFVDDNNEPVELPLDPEMFEEIEEAAGEYLYEKKFAKELEF